MGSYPGLCTKQGLFSPLLLAATLAPRLRCPQPDVPQRLPGVSPLPN